MFHRKRTGGWSLIELTIILIVLAILVAILAPVIERYVYWAKVIRVREDVQMLGTAIWMFLMDTGLTHFLEDGDDQTSDTVINLVGDGDIPANATNEREWTDVVDVGNDVDFMARHLSYNDPYGPVANTDGYLTPSDMGLAAPGGAGIGPGGFPGPFFSRVESAFNPEFAWRGPYVTPPIDPDPWGNRYMASVKWLDPDMAADANDLEHDTIVISAGPNEDIETFFDTSNVAYTYPEEATVPLGDDFIYTVSANAL